MLQDRATECKSGKAVMLQLGKSGASLSKYWHVCKQTEGSFQQAALWLPEQRLDQRCLVLCGNELMFTEYRMQAWISSSCDDSGKIMGSQDSPAACLLPTCTTSGCSHFSFWKIKLSLPLLSNFQSRFLQENIQDSLYLKWLAQTEFCSKSWVPLTSSSKTMPMIFRWLSSLLWVVGCGEVTSMSAYKHRSYQSESFSWIHEFKKPVFHRINSYRNPQM